MSRGQRIAYVVVRSALRLVMLLLTRIRVCGREHVPLTGAGIVVSNHIAAVDPGVLMAVLPRPIALMSKVENARGILKLFIPLLGAFTVRRGADTWSIKATRPTVPSQPGRAWTRPLSR